MAMSAPIALSSVVSREAEGCVAPFRRRGRVMITCSDQVGASLEVDRTSRGTLLRENRSAPDLLRNATGSEHRPHDERAFKTFEAKELFEEAYELLEQHRHQPTNATTTIPQDPMEQFKKRESFGTRATD